jgi:hypothetical protein
VRKLLARRVRVHLEETDRRHRETRHAEGALEALLVHDGLLHGMQLLAVGEPFNRLDLPPPDSVRQHRARIVRHIVDQHRAGAALGAVAADLGARQSELVAQRHRERFLLHHVDAAHLAVDVQRDETLDGAGRRRLAEDFTAGAEEVGGRRHHRAARNNTLDEGAARQARTRRVGQVGRVRRVGVLRLIHHVSCEDG